MGKIMENSIDKIDTNVSVAGGSGQNVSNSITTTATTTTSTTNNNNNIVPNDAVVVVAAATAADATTGDKKKTKETKGKVTKVKTKRRKKKIPRPSDAPKHPLTGYVRFMNVRREELRKIYPTSSAIEITKIIGEEWNGLNEENRKPYLAAAEIDKERYNREWMAYIAKKKSDESSSEATTTETQIKTNGFDVPQTITATTTTTTTVLNNNQSITAPAVASKLPQSGDYDIPIFTEEFLEHNKNMESKLRTLRKSNTDYEQQNSVLERHVENMNAGIDKLTTEMIELKSNYEVLNNYLLNLKKKLSNAFSTLSIPNELNGANMDNIHKYMMDLHRMATSNSHGPASLNKAKDIIRKLDLQIIATTTTTTTAPTPPPAAATTTSSV